MDDELDKLIPSSILEYKYVAPTRKSRAKNKPTAETDYKTHARKSGFLLTINPHESAKKHNTSELMREASRKLLRVNKHVESKIRDGSWLRQRPVDAKAELEFKAPPVERYETRLEIGEKMKRLHAHSTIVLSGTAFVNVDPIREYCRESYGKNCHISCRWFQPESQGVLDRYLAKGQQQPAVPQPAEPVEKLPLTLKQMGEAIPEAKFG